MYDKQILYFADPMCSWCWGFSPVIHQIASTYSETLSVHIHLGGLRAGNTKVMDHDQRMYILNHWFSVHEASGQPFDFSFQMPAGFIYDTEPACRAVKTMQNLNRQQDLNYLSAIQHAFYAKNKDVTQTDVLSMLAVVHGPGKAEFEKLFESDDIRQRTRDDFILSRKMGVNGFPCLIGKKADEYAYIAQGFQLFSQVERTIETWLG